MVGYVVSGQFTITHGVVNKLIHYTEHWVLLYRNSTAKKIVNRTTKNNNQVIRQHSQKADYIVLLRQLCSHCVLSLHLFFLKKHSMYCSWNRLGGLWTRWGWRQGGKGLVSVTGSSTGRVAVLYPSVMTGTESLKGETRVPPSFEWTAGGSL